MMQSNENLGLTETETSHLAALEKPEPVVPRGLTEEVPGRIDYKRSVVIRARVRALWRKVA